MFLAFKVPDYWDDNLAEDVFHKIKLTPGSDEYKKVEDAFKAGLPDWPPGGQITQIWLLLFLFGLEK